MNENRKTSQKSMAIVVGALLVVIVGISVAYAAMSSSLTINATNVTQSSISWNVGFQSGSVTPVAGGSGDTGRSCGTATVTSSSVTVANTTLSKPDDSCTYALVIKNTGGIDAKLGSITPKSPDSTSCTNSNASMVCGNITYKLTTDSTGENLLTANTTIPKTNGTQNVYLVVKYTGTELVSSNITQANGGFTLVYNQN